ncbi:hypothetical protein D3C79_1078680 [compost metagenome]
MIIGTNLAPGVSNVFQQLDHFGYRRFVVMQISLQQATLHVVIQRGKIIGHLTALLVVEAAFQTVINNIDGF